MSRSLRYSFFIFTLFFILIECPKITAAEIDNVSTDPTGSCVGVQNLKLNINNGHLSGCIQGTWQLVSGGGGGGTGTVTHTGALVNNAVVTGNGAADTKTPSPTTTLDASGNFTTPGNFSAGSVGTATTTRWYDSMGVKYYGIAAPANITGSGCDLVYPPGNPAGQSISYAAPVSGKCVGSWATAGGAATLYDGAAFALLGWGGDTNAPSTTSLTNGAGVRFAGTWGFAAPAMNVSKLAINIVTACDVACGYVAVLFDRTMVHTLCKTVVGVDGTAGPKALTFTSGELVTGGVCAWRGGGGILLFTSDNNAVNIWSTGANVPNTLAEVLSTRNWGTAAPGLTGITGTGAGLTVPIDLSGVTFSATNFSVRTPLVMIGN